jgi:membrane protease YdiL (CAAX protease family)
MSVFTLTAIAITIIMTWVFNHTWGSLLIVMLIHNSVNTSNESHPVKTVAFFNYLWYTCS